MRVRGIIWLRYDLDAVKRRLTMPILCMVGEEETLITPDIVKALANALPDSRLRRSPDAVIRSISRMPRSSTNWCAISCAKSATRSRLVRLEMTQ